MIIAKLKCTICNREHSATPAEGLPYHAINRKRANTVCPNGHTSNTTIILEKDISRINKTVEYGTLPTGPVLDVDLVAFIDACDLAGVTLTGTEESALSALIASLKANRTWEKCVAIYPFVGSSAASHKFNLKNPVDSDGAFRLTFVGSPSHSANGVAWNGTTQYADTHVNPALNLEQNNTHLSYYSRSNSGAAESEIGVYVSALVRGLYLNINFSGTEYKAVNSAETAGATGLGTASQGLFTASRYLRDSEMHKRPTLAVSTTVKTSAADAFLSQNIYIGCINTDGVAASFTNKSCAFASIGLGLSQLQLESLQTIVQTFQTTLSRQV